MNNLCQKYVKEGYRHLPIHVDLTYPLGIIFIMSPGNIEPDFCSLDFIFVRARMNLQIRTIPSYDCFILPKSFLPGLGSDIDFLIPGILDIEDYVTHYR